MKLSNWNSEKYFRYVVLIFVIWSFGFIYRSSFLGVDGKQYFSLFDDAMISMRYAWNLANGFGLVWNIGERIQGYSNLLMTLIMTIANFLLEKRFATLSIQILGSIFMIGIAYSAMKIGEFFIRPKTDQHIKLFIRIVIFTSILSYYPLAFWSLMGMETGILSLLMVFSILSSLKYIKTKNNNNLYFLAIYLGLAFLTRIDSIIFALIIWIYIGVENVPRGFDKKFFLNYFPAIFLYLLFVIGLLAFQYFYYGEIFPNTYTLKLTGMSLLMRVKNGIGFIKQFLIENSLILMLVVISLINNFQKQKLLLFLVILASIGYQIYVGGDVWNYWRLLSPIIPFAIVLGVNTLVDIGYKIQEALVMHASFEKKRLIQEEFRLETIITLFMIIVIFTANIRFLPEILLERKPYESIYSQYHVNTALLLNEILSEEATIGVTSAGALPYYSGRKAIDFLGKNDRYIANLLPDLSGEFTLNGMESVPGHNKYDLNYSIKTLKPTYVQNVKWARQDLTQWAKDYYVLGVYKGYQIFLLKNSLDIKWERITILDW